MAKKCMGCCKVFIHNRVESSPVITYLYLCQCKQTTSSKLQGLTENKNFQTNYLNVD